MEEVELKEYYQIYTDCWKMFRRFSNPLDTDEFWNNLVSTSDEIFKSTEKKEFAKKMILATLDEIENVFKEKY